MTAAIKFYSPFNICAFVLSDIRPSERINATTAIITLLRSVINPDAPPLTVVRYILLKPQRTLKSL